MKVDLVLKNCKIVSPREILECGIAIENGVITTIARTPHLPLANKVIDIKGKPILPGPIDGHCHATSPPDDPKSASKAAAKGGITTILDMPGYQVPVFSPNEYLKKLTSFSECYVDYTLHGAAASGYPKGSLKGMWEMGATGIKFFVSNPGSGWPQTFDGEIIQGFKELAQVGGLALVHCENDQIIRYNMKKMKELGRKDYAAYLEVRPRIAEIESGKRIIKYIEETSCRGLIVHTSIPETVYQARKARLKGVEVYIETCPQYLYLTDEDVKEIGPWVKFAPPARPKETVDEMRRLIGSGWIDTVATDHAPFTKQEKMVGTTDMLDAPNGIPGLDTFMPLLLNGVNEGWLTLHRLAEISSENPAQIYDLYPRKGALQPGSDADLIVVDMKKTYKLSDDNIISACGWTPYDDLTVKGMPIMTILRGNIVMKDNQVMDGPGLGQYISRPSARVG
jgi:dihydroorotase (multifunctional complex type)